MKMNKTLPFDEHWSRMSDLTIFQAGFWMQEKSDPLDHEHRCACDGSYENHFYERGSEAVHKKCLEIDSAIRVGSIKITKEIRHNDLRLDFDHTRILKSDWIDWCYRNGYSELADRFTYPSNALQQETAEEIEAVAGTSLSSIDMEEQAPANVDHNETLAALFDPLPVEALAKMFITDVAQWEKWADRADRNGLKSARQGRKIFNPYKAGIWFVRNGAEGWDDARLYRALANNLPARSSDKEHLLTGGID